MTDRMLIPCQRKLFDIPADVAYLNCAYLSPWLREAKAATNRAMERESQPWRIKTPHFFEGPDILRTLFSRLINAAPDNVAIVPSASYGIAVAARNLPVAAHQTIVLLQDQYPSNVYAWRRLAQASGARIDTVPRPADHDWTAAVLATMSTDTAVVAIPNCHWMDGGLLDLAAIGEAARTTGAALVIDGSQSLGALPLDVSRVQPDFLVSCGYKWLLCPYTVSFLYVAPHRQQGEPIEENGLNRNDAQNFAGLADYRDDYLAGARRFDVGERAHFTLIQGAIAALRQLLAWEVSSIQLTLGLLTGQIAARAETLGLTALPAHQRAGHFLGVTFGTAVPTGLLEALEHSNVYISVRGKSMRITPHLYNNEADIERLFSVLTRLMEHSAG